MRAKLPSMTTQKMILACEAMILDLSENILVFFFLFSFVSCLFYQHVLSPLTVGSQTVKETPVFKTGSATSTTGQF